MSPSALQRPQAWDRVGVGVADFVLWEGMFSEQKSVPKKYLERKFSFGPVAQPDRAAVS
jgi:hypothetical protein